MPDIKATTLPSACTRRAFIKTLGLGAAAAALPAWAATGWKMRLATSSIHFEKLPLADACAEISRLGFEAIDIWDKFQHGCPHLDEAEKLGGGGLKELLTRHKLKLSAFTLYKTNYEQYAALLGAAGGGVVVRGSAAGKFTPEETPARMRKFFEQLKPSIELAEKHHGILAIENHGGALLSTLDSFKAFVELNPAPRRVGLALAPFHVQRLGASVPEFIRVCGAQLRFFYAWQLPRTQQAEGLEQLPGIGPADFQPWLAALAAVDYAGYVNPFIHTMREAMSPEEMSAALAKSRDYLRRTAA